MNHRDQRPMTAEEAGKVYDILVETCGAVDWDEVRKQFVQAQITENHGYTCGEYRFGGIMGFGGKFRRNDHRWFVNYYPEDELPEREEAQEAANKKLELYYNSLSPSTNIMFRRDGRVELNEGEAISVEEAKRRLRGAYQYYPESYRRALELLETNCVRR